MSNYFSQLNIFSQCKKYNIPLRQCPQFLFVIMGFGIMLFSITFYTIGERHVTDPRMVAIAVLLVSIFLMIIAFTITHSFENLAEANRIKAEFVNIVSHQLRAPLTNLKWAIQSLSSEKFSQALSDYSTEYFDAIKENGARMEKLIDDLLIITRLKEKGVRDKKSSFSLAALTQEVVSEHKSFIKASNLNIDLKTPDDLLDVFASRFLVKIVIENLVGNAIRYSKGGDKIFIELEASTKKVKFKIRDQGIGISKKDQKYIFQKFFRAQNAVKRKVYGTGLGLFIVKLILDGIKGKVWFVSKEKEGSAFYFTLPTRQ